jgi:hypothetical protein
MEGRVGLVLQPTFNDKTREEIETHLMEVRARRMLAVATYYQGINAKATAQMAKEQARMQREYGLLLRDIAKLDKIAEEIEKRMIKVEQHLNLLREAEGKLVEVETEENGNGDDQEPDDDRGTEKAAAFESNRPAAPRSSPYRGWERK